MTGLVSHGDLFVCAFDQNSIYDLIVYFYDFSLMFFFDIS